MRIARLQPQQTILMLFKPLQRGIAMCMTCQNTKVSVGAVTINLGNTTTI